MNSCFHRGLLFLMLGTFGSVLVVQRYLPTYVHISTIGSIGGIQKYLQDPFKDISILNGVNIQSSSRNNENGKEDVVEKLMILRRNIEDMFEYTTNSTEVINSTTQIEIISTTIVSANTTTLSTTTAPFETDSKSLNLKIKLPKTSKVKHRFTISNNNISTEIPGIFCMDKFLKLPPEVRVRPNSKEPILHFSQKRDFPRLTIHEDVCHVESSKKFNSTDKIILLMAVKSICRNSKRRASIRKTWGNATWTLYSFGVKIKLIFLLGACSNPKLSKSVQKEDKFNNDILQWDFVDSFRNLTLKEVLFLQWFSRTCSHVPYIFKGDDDVYVNTKNIINFLSKLSPDLSKNLFVGSRLIGSPRILNPTWKYYVSYNLYPYKFYPAYVSGGGFLMSSDVAVRAFQASLKTRMIPIDDAFLGILMKSIGVSPQNDPGFKSWGLKSKTKCELAKVKTYHKVTPDELIKIWKDMQYFNSSVCTRKKSV